MPHVDRGTVYSNLSSNWEGLSPHLIATFYPVRRAEKGNWEREPNSIAVCAPLTDGTIEQTANWTSPFENQQADAKLSSVSALMQMDGIQPLLELIANQFGKESIVGNRVSGMGKVAATLAGRTGVTKLNSTQIFSGMPPLKITATAHFRALENAEKEVRIPMDQLMSWALPKELSKQGFVGNFIDKDEPIGWKTLFPSETPQIIGMQYADCQFLPMVIESLPTPLTGPRDRNGRLLSASITFTLGSLSALDKSDWAATRYF